MIRSSLNESLIYLLAAIFCLGCAVAPPGDIAQSADPKTEINRLNEEMSNAQKNNVDVLAREQYLRSKTYLTKASQSLVDEKDQQETIEYLRFARDFLNKATLTSRGRMIKASGLLESRQNAIAAGASRSVKLKDEWNDIDDDIGDIADRLDRISPSELGHYQARYVELEKEAIVETHLGGALQKVDRARVAGANKLAPNSLRESDISFKNAESLIGSNVSNPDEFKQAVIRANEDADFLLEVVKVINQDKRLTEATAVEIVLQQREIIDLKQDLLISEKMNSDVEQRLGKKSRSLSAKERALNQAKARNDMQSAIDLARQQFQNNEAEVYQQGNRLLIRLKSINFKSGSSELPAQSLLLLAKVSKVARSLNATQIRVEGHTDSIGPSIMNKQLSGRRAITVATYLSSNGLENSDIRSAGYGFEAPIATNKTKVGRAQNRRVDLVITPLAAPFLEQ